MGLARLQYLLHSGSIAVLYGQTGVGKSTLLKLFLSQIPQNLFLPIYLHFTHLKSSSLLSLIVSQLGEIPKHTKDRLFLQIMDKSLRSNLTPIIVIDEAHLLKPTPSQTSDSLSALRLILPLISKSSSRDRNTSNISSKETSMPTSHNASRYITTFIPLLKLKPLHT
ncbi:MAG: ATP-binding protein [Planctomycetia bacterium]|nr:ATP-binding protein [Planctomycetia bacterium]